jgi:hypothetical protein
MILSGMVRRAARVGMGGPADLSLSEFGNLRTDKFLPDYATLAKARRIYGATTGTGTAVAPVQAVPTTAAAWGLFNGEDPGGKSYAILFAGCHSISGTLGLGLALLGTVATAPVTGTKPTAYANAQVSSLSGSKSLSAAVLASAVTLVVPQPAWITLAARDQVSAVSVGSGLVADVKGMLVIPPQYVGGFTVLAPAGTTALFGIDLVWAELELDLE